MKLICKKCGCIIRVVGGGLIMPCRKCINIAHARGVKDGIMIERTAEKAFNDAKTTITLPEAV